MISNHRNLIFILCLCVALVGVSAAVKINRQLSDSRNISQIQSDVTTASKSNVPSQPDPNFLENQKKNAVVEKPKSASLSGQTSIPGVTAIAYLVGNVKTGKIYLEKNSNRVLPVASMSKLVTAFVATDVFSATSTITITEQAVLAPPDGSNLMVGEHFTLKEILQPLLLNSSNIAAEAISSTENQAAFLELMRSYAWEVGMPHSFFADPSGVSPQNVASAEDLFGLAKYLVYYRPDILTMTRMPMASIATTTEHGSHQFVSTHPFVNDPRFVGGKTGRTEEAGETMMTILNIADQPIAFIILGARYGARENDTRILLENLKI